MIRHLSVFSSYYTSVTVCPTKKNTLIAATDRCGLLTMFFFSCTSPNDFTVVLKLQREALATVAQVLGLGFGDDSSNTGNTSSSSRSSSRSSKTKKKKEAHQVSHGCFRVISFQTLSRTASSLSFRVRVWRCHQQPQQQLQQQLDEERKQRPSDLDGSFRMVEQHLIPNPFP